MLRIPKRPLHLLPTAPAILAVALYTGVLFRLCADHRFYTAIRLMIYNPSMAPRLKKIYGNLPPRRNYTTINLDGNQENNRIKLAFSMVRIREIIQRNDGIAGMHFHFSDSSTYGNFISVLNMLAVEEARRYIADGSEIWYFHQPEEPVIPTVVYEPEVPCPVE